jgi:hypothetical protein
VAHHGDAGREKKSVHGSTRSTNGVVKTQPKSKQTFHHEGRKQHEVRNQNVIVSESFVPFVRFVVTLHLLINSAIWKRCKFAQAAKTLRHSSAEKPKLPYGKTKLSEIRDE